MECIARHKDRIVKEDGKYVIPHDLYLSDFLQLPKENCLLLADPGLGKSTWAKEFLIQNPNAYILMNTIPNMEQLKASAPDEIKERIVQFERILCIENATHLIIDEIDILYNSFFRGKSVMNVYKFIADNMDNCQIIGMTGTLIKEFLIPELKVFRFTKKHNRDLQVIQVSTTGPVMTVGNIVHYLEEIALDSMLSELKVLAFVPSNEKGLEAEAELTRKGFRTKFISRSTMDVTYEKILTDQRGLYAVDYDIFIVTPFFNSGLSFGKCVTVTFDNVPEIIVQQHNRQRGELINDVMQYAPSYHICGPNMQYDINTNVGVIGDVSIFLHQSVIAASGNLDLNIYDLTTDSKDRDYLSVVEAYSRIEHNARKNILTGGILKRLNKMYGFNIVPIEINESKAAAEVFVKHKKLLVSKAQELNVAFNKIPARVVSDIISASKYKSYCDKYEAMERLFNKTVLAPYVDEIFNTASNEFVNSMCILQHPRTNKAHSFRAEVYTHKEIEGKLDKKGFDEMAKEFWSSFIPFSPSASHIKVYKNYITRIRPAYKEANPKNINSTFWNRMSSLEKTMSKKGKEFSIEDFMGKMKLNRDTINGMSKEEWKNARADYLQK